MPDSSSASAPVRLVFFNPGGGLGGGERSLLDLILALRRARPGWSYRMIAAAQGPFAEHARRAGCEVLSLPLPRNLARQGDSALTTGARRSLRALALLRVVPGTAEYLWRLRRILAALQPDLIHSNGLKGHLLTAWAAPHGVPVIWHLRDYIGPRPLVAPLLRASAFRCAAAITNSRSVADDARRRLPRSLPVTTAYDAVHLEQFAPEGPAADLDVLAGLPAPAAPLVRIGLLGTFAKWKGHEVLFRALAQLPVEPPWRAYVIGDAVYETGGSQYRRAELERMAAQAGVAPARLGFTGFVAQPEQALRALDIVVHASTQPEPFGRVIVEGMACAKAVVVSSTGGAAELVEEGDNALTYPPGDAAGLAGCLSSLIGNSGLRARLGGAGRVRAQRFALARIEQDLLPLYRSVLGERALT